MKSSNQSIFAQVPAVNIPRSVFPRNRTYKTTLDAGYLVPVYVDDVLPGDTFNVSLQAFMRLTTPIVPFMDNLMADFFFFFVPNRLVWENWQRFCGERDNPVSDYNNDASYLVPQLTPKSGQGFAVGSLADYFGLPTGVQNLSVDAMPFRGYNLIWNEFFRDENLQNSVTVDVGDSTVDDTNYNILRTAQRPTYFNKALPWPQKGPNVELPLGVKAPVYSEAPYGQFTLGDQSGTNSWYVAQTNLNSVGAGVGNYRLSLIKTSDGTAVDSVQGGLKPVALNADLTNATSASINAIREAFQIQLFYEQSARGGTRYIEILKSMFGVTSPDARLQRPEYLGGGHIPIQIHSVTQTSATSAGVTPQGNLAAYGVAGGRVGFSKSFVEHGYVFGFVRIRSDVTYQQGIDRMWSRKTKFDYYWPPFAHLGEQAILNKEIFAQGSSVLDSNGSVVDEQPFGYQERYSEYRYGISHVTGQMRSTFAQSLDVWHLGYEYANLPVLGSTFIEENPPLSRVLAVQNKPQFLFDSLVTCNCVRPLPTYSVPGRVDHF